MNSAPINDMALAPQVGMIMGSQSDWETMALAVDALQALVIPHEVRIASAHRTPEHLPADLAFSAAVSWAE